MTTEPDTLSEAADETAILAKLLADEVLAAWNAGFIGNGHLIHRSNEVLNCARYVARLVAEQQESLDTDSQPR